MNSTFWDNHSFPLLRFDEGTLRFKMDSCIAKFRGHKYQVIALATDAPSNASWLASGSECGQVRIFDLETQRTTRGMKLPQSIGSIISHKGSNTLHVASGPSIYTFDLRSPQGLILAIPSPRFESAADEINQVGRAEYYIDPRDSLSK